MTPAEGFQVAYGPEEPAWSRTNDRSVLLFVPSLQRYPVAGLVLPQHAPSPVTNRMFGGMVSMLCFCTGPMVLFGPSCMLSADDSPLAPGCYTLQAANPTDQVYVNQDRPVVRAMSFLGGRRTMRFTKRVTRRDAVCVATGAPFSMDHMRGFRPAHIYPLSHEAQWKRDRMDECLPEAVPANYGGPINSPRNGLLLTVEMWELFQSYAFSINPDDDYKIVWFKNDPRMASFRARLHNYADDDERPCDDLLRWHYYQSVLANLPFNAAHVQRPSVSAQIQFIQQEPNAAQMMEAELFSRLGAQMELGDAETGEDEDASGVSSASPGAALVSGSEVSGYVVV